MKELRELYDYGQLNTITEKSKLPKYALAKLSYSFARADLQNSNRRTYSENILSREINRKSEELRTQKIPGMLEHPLGVSGATRLDGIAHVLTDVSYDRHTKLASAESYILNTSKGKDFMTMLEAEIQMGCSMRGWGNVKDGYVQSDWKLDSLDFVLHPSFGSDATIDKSNIIESANSLFDEKENKGENMKDKMMGLTEDYVQEMMQSCFEIYKDEENFKGNFNDFRKENGTAILAEILVAEEKCEDTETALKHLEKFGETTKRVPIAPIKKVTSAEVYLEARIAGIDPKIYAEKLNANLERQEESDSDLSLTEIVSALQEARMGGIDTSDKNEKKKVLDIVRKQKTRKVVITEDEQAEIVAKKTGSTVELVKEIWAIERKKKAKTGHYDLLVKERMLGGFGSEIRPESRKISQKILDKEK